MWVDEKQKQLRNHATSLITFLSLYQMSHWHVTEISVLQIVFILKENLHPYFNTWCNAKLLIPNDFLTFSSFTQSCIFFKKINILITKFYKAVQSQDSKNIYHQAGF